MPSGKRFKPRGQGKNAGKRGKSNQQQQQEQEQSQSTRNQPRNWRPKNKQQGNTGYERANGNNQYSFNAPVTSMRMESKMTAFRHSGFGSRYDDYGYDNEGNHGYASRPRSVISFVKGGKLSSDNDDDVKQDEAEVEEQKEVEWDKGEWLDDVDNQIETSSDLNDDEEQNEQVVQSEETVVQINDHGEDASQARYEEQYSDCEKHDLYDEQLDDEDRLVNHTQILQQRRQQQSSSPFSYTAKRHRFILDSQFSSSSDDDYDDKKDDTTEVDRLERSLPDDQLFVNDKDVQFQVDAAAAIKEEILFAPRRIRLSSAGVKLDTRRPSQSTTNLNDLNLLTTVSFTTVRVVDESVVLDKNATEKLRTNNHDADNSGPELLPPVVAARQRPSRKSKNRQKSRRGNYSFADLSIYDNNKDEYDEDIGDEIDPLDDYIQNLLDDYKSSRGGRKKYKELVTDNDDVDDDDDGRDDAASEDESGNEDGAEVEISDNSDEEEDDDDDENDDVDLNNFYDDYDDNDDDDILDAEVRAMNDMLLRTSAKMKKAPRFNVSDEELEAKLQAQWLKDKESKKRKKKEREELRRQGKLGKKNNGKRNGSGPDLSAKYRKGMTAADIKHEIESFLLDDGKSTLSLPPMTKHSRKSVHILAHAFNLQSKSVGAGSSRFSIIYKDSATSYLELDSRSIARFNDDKFFANGKYRGVSNNHDKNNGNGKLPKQFNSRTGQFRHRDGDLVGGNAPEIGSNNIGRRLLERMGWDSGTGLGAVGNVGMAQPIFAKVKTSKAGLG
ncbi:hypothetical protein V1514DRAFT_108758 [Lipomyces japonicus]|uniref:uncharacterized protein n=1 Tax=Lipomyces japonicus TaxID=56871 RepID=UPI0034CEF76E